MFPIFPYAVTCVLLSARLGRFPAVGSSVPSHHWYLLYPSPDTGPQPFQQVTESGNGYQGVGPTLRKERLRSNIRLCGETTA